MSGIGEEIREFVQRSYKDEHMDPRELLALADRVDREMVEMPRDRDGVPIHVGDTVYLDNGRKAEVSRIVLGWDKTSIDLWLCDKGCFFFSVAPKILTHTAPDSLEAIAGELDDLSESGEMADETSADMRELAGRIRNIARGRDDGCR